MRNAQLLRSLDFIEEAVESLLPFVRGRIWCGSFELDKDESSGRGADCYALPRFTRYDPCGICRHVSECNDRGARSQQPTTCFARLKPFPSPSGL